MIKEFLLDIVRRLIFKTPKFFNVLKTILIVIAVITGLPELLTTAGVVLPMNIDLVVTNIVSVASLMGAFISQLTVASEDQKYLDFK